MNEEQLYDAAEREMDLYRAEITRLHAAHEAEIATLTDQCNRVSETADQLREQLGAVMSDETAALLQRAQEAVAFERERADQAEAQLAALEEKLGLAIDGAVQCEQARAEAADAKLDEIRSTLKEFLRNYGDSDLAVSIQKILDGTAGKPAPEGEVPGA